jgi:hypothetical protein
VQRTKWRRCGGRPRSSGAGARADHCGFEFGDRVGLLKHR